MNIFSFQLTDGSTLKAASSTFLDVDLRSRMSSHTRLTMKPFPEMPIDNVAATSICIRAELEANGGVSGGASHKFNNFICHGPETAEITEVEKLHKSYAMLFVEKM